MLQDFKKNLLAAKLHSLFSVTYVTYTWDLPVDKVTMWVIMREKYYLHINYVLNIKIVHLLEARGTS